MKVEGSNPFASTKKAQESGFFHSSEEQKRTAFFIGVCLWFIKQMGKEIESMITLRNGVTAFLHNNGEYLLMKRADNRKIAPGVWSGVGGHMEQSEINDPLTACYREIEEETGISRDKISSLKLLYIITRRSKDEIRQSYIYFGETAQEEVIQTDEGNLFWIAEGAL
ncbi:MAG TPA: hypothetical protein DDZ53_04545, partial [Firmicutes bacterium]|nr:hypothetical protein [Bacillota bacterium]